MDKNNDLKSSRPYVIFITNKTYYGNVMDNSYEEAVLNVWLQANNKERNKINIIKERIEHGYIMRNGFYARNFWRQYKSCLTGQQNLCILFNALTDIHPNPKIAISFLAEIAGHSDKIKIYILSFNLYNDVCGHYISSLKNIYKIRKLTVSRKPIKGTREQLLRFAFFLRREKGFSYKGASIHTDISPSIITKRYNEKYPDEPRFGGKTIVLSKDKLKEYYNEFLQRSDYSS